MVEAVPGVDYTKVIQKINGSLTKLSYSKKEQDDEGVDLAQQGLLKYAQIILEDKNTSAAAIKQHYNEVTYNINNGIASATPYLKTSIIREIMQNIIDCRYKGDQLEINIAFDDETDSIVFTYNEEGFTISNIISFLSLDHTSKDSNNTGAFGLGAKGAILNSKGLEIKSLYRPSEEGPQYGSILKISHKINYGKKQIVIDKLEFNDNEKGENYTELKLCLDRGIYKEIKLNLYDLIGKEGKGKYITPIDLMFASIKQPDKTITINITNLLPFSICYNKNNNQVNFYYDNSLVVGLKVFIGAESKFSYLIPSSRHEKDEMPNFITNHNYNYFSTYELTGALEGSNLPKFFINIPTIDIECENNEDAKYYITNDRKGVNENKKVKVETIIAGDFIEIVKAFENDLIIFTQNWGLTYIVKYLFEFIEFQLKRNILDDDWRIIEKDFISKIRINHNDELIKLSDVKKYGHNNNLVSAAQKLKDNVILFCEKEFEFRYTKFDLKINYYFVLFGEKLPVRKYVHLNDQYQDKYNLYSILNFKDSNFYTNSDIIDRILYNLEYRDGTEILLISAEADPSFTENTLLMLLEAIDKDRRIAVDFNVQDNNLYVGRKTYSFTNEFTISEKKTLYYADRLNRIIGKEFFELICWLYKKNLFNSEIEWSSFQQIKLYKENAFQLEYDHKSKNLLNVYLNYQGSKIKTDVVDITCITYEEIVKITGLTNYELLIDKSVDNFDINQNIIDAYSLDLEVITQYSNLDDVDNILNKIMIGTTELKLGEKDLVAFVKDGQFKEIIQFENVTSSNVLVEFDYILIIAKKNKDGNHTKISLSKISGVLDTLLNCDGKIKQFYRPVKSPLVKMLDQFDYKLKPILSVNEEEIEILKGFLGNVEKDSSGKKKEPKFFFAKDLNNKLYGYSTCCSLCKYKTDILNAFQLKKIEYADNGEKRKLTLYVCANHYYESEGWVIFDLTFQNSEGEYNISFDEWISTICENNYISPNLLKCKLQIVKKSSYQLFGLDDENEEQSNKRVSYRFILTPLMAVKWLVENS